MTAASTPTGRSAQCSVCDAIVPTVRRTSDGTERYPPHPNPHPASRGYDCCESNHVVWEYSVKKAARTRAAQQQAGAA